MQDASAINKKGATKLSAKEAAEYFGILPTTLRFYEREGVIPPVQRDKNGCRVYTDADMNWVYLALVLKHAGLSLEKITEFMHLVSKKTGNTRIAQKQILYDQLHEIDEKLRNLEDVRARLQWEIDNFSKYLGQINITIPTNEERYGWRNFKAKRT